MDPWVGPAGRLRGLQRGWQQMLHADKSLAPRGAAQLLRSVHWNRQIPVGKV